MSNLLGLLQLSDPVLPIGGFSHSYGLETYVQKGIVHEKDSARHFIVQMLSQNILNTDAAFMSLAYDAASENDIERLFALDQECTAFKAPREIRFASHKLGNRLLKIFGSGDNEIVEKYKEAVNRQITRGNYSVVFGMFAVVFKVTKTDALTGFFYNAAAGMVTNCVKLVPLGQLDGQQILISLHPLIEQLVEKALMPDPEIKGFCCAAFDIRCMQHERLYSRLYMS